MKIFVREVFNPISKRLYSAYIVLFKRHTFDFFMIFFGSQTFKKYVKHALNETTEVKPAEEQEVRAREQLLFRTIAVFEDMSRNEFSVFNNFFNEDYDFKEQSSPEISIIQQIRSVLRDEIFSIVFCEASEE